MIGLPCHRQFRRVTLFPLIPRNRTRLSRSGIQQMIELSLNEHIWIFWSCMPPLFGFESPNQVRRCATGILLDFRSHGRWFEPRCLRAIVCSHGTVFHSNRLELSPSLEYNSGGLSISPCNV